MHVLHISASLLAGAPGMLSDALEDFGIAQSSVHFRAGDWGLHRNVMSPETIPLENKPLYKELFAEHYKKADIIHVHNFVPRFVLAWIAEIGTIEKDFFYQIHSPKYERPTFDSLADYHGLKFAKKLVVCHYHPRQNPDYIAVPNTLYRKHLPRFTSVNAKRELLRVAYSPSTAKRGRWVQKSNDRFDLSLKSIKNKDYLELIELVNLAPQTLSSLRFLTDVTIDEVVTGSYHLVSYEGLAAGTAVINGVDPLSIEAFKMGFKAPKPPFITSTPEDIGEILYELNHDKAYLNEIKQESLKFFNEWMNPHRTASIFGKIYAQ